MVRLCYFHAKPISASLASIITGCVDLGSVWHSTSGIRVVERIPSLRSLRGMPSIECLGFAGRLHTKPRRPAETLFGKAAGCVPIGSEHTIVALASYLSRLDANSRPVQGSGEHLRVGQELYTHICAACHGADGRGEQGNHVPRIAGQHYPYLRRQIEAAADLHKDLAPPEMTSALRGRRAQEKDAVADYVSRLGNSEVLLDSNRLEGARK